VNIIELTVSSCQHMVKGVPPKFLNPILGSGVIVQYRKRFFVCTVEHFTRVAGQEIGIVTGRIKDSTTEIFVLGDFSYIQAVEFEDEPDAEDLIYAIENPKSGKFLDIAFKEIATPRDLVQPKRVIELADGGVVRIPYGPKNYLTVDEDFQIDEDEVFSFFGRIKPIFSKGKLEFQEALYLGLTFKGFKDPFFELDLGGQIKDFNRFRGCSGAPILDSEGRLVALVTHGPKNNHSTSVFGFRFDYVKQYIDLMYFSKSV
jgi:hypothetical protein